MEQHSPNGYGNSDKVVKANELLTLRPLRLPRTSRTSSVTDGTLAPSTPEVTKGSAYSGRTRSLEAAAGCAGLQPEPSELKQPTSTLRNC